MSSFGDFISLSDVCDVDTARLIKREVSDGVIAPGYEPEALEILKQKKKGNYNVIQIDPEYEPAALERKDVFGITFEQGRNELKIDDDFFANIVTENKELPKAGEDRSGHFHDHFEIYSVQFRMLCKRRTGHRYRRRAAVPDPLYQTGRDQSRQLVAASVSPGDESAVRRFHPPCRPGQCH